MITQRKLKLQQQHSPRAYHRYRHVPVLRLAGVWLEEIGFTAGQVVIVTVRDEEITIKKLKS